MSTTVPAPSRRASSRTRLGAVAAGAALAASALLAPSGGASAAPSNQCPAAFPATGLSPAQHVTGSTVSSGTTLDPIEGSYIGTINDGIAPGVDMLLFKITGSVVTTPTGEVDRGIWAGMSGSPLYADDGRLVGSVSYGLSWSPSDIAGVTPAADIYKLKKYDPAARARLTKAALGRLRAVGAAAPSGASMEQLRIPTSVNSVLSLARINAIAKKTHFTGRTLRKSGSSARGLETPVPIEAGGNIAATDAYGSVTIGSVGTATAVCGSSVYAYGHPANFSGPASLTMHGATAVYVQKDAVFGSFKVANIGAPSGAFTQDRLTGILGKLGAAPRSTSLTSSTRASNGNSRTSKTFVSVADALGFATYVQVANDGVLALDGWQGGSASTAWKIVVQRRNGSILTYARSNRYADRYYLSDYPPEGPALDVEQILDNDFEPVTIRSVSTSNTLSTVYRSYVIDRVQAKQHGVWVKVKDETGLEAKAGKRLRLRVGVKPDKRSSGSAQVLKLSVKVPKKAKNKVGSLQILGNGPSSSEEFRTTGRAGEPTSLPGLLTALASAPHSDDVTADLVFGTGKRIPPKSDVARAPGVVTGATFAYVAVTKG